MAVAAWLCDCGCGCGCGCGCVWLWLADGIHTFLYTFLDTANPMANMPKPIENPGFSYILELLQRLLPNSTKTGAEGGFYNLFMQAMNHRCVSNLCC